MLPKTKNPKLLTAITSTRLKANKLKAHRPRFVILLLLLVTLIASSAFFIYHRNQEETKRETAATLAADKADFAIVEAEMTKAYDAIVKTTGTPKKDEHQKGCSRSEIKFTTGNLNCSVDITIVYDETSIATANEKARKIDGAFSNKETMDIKEPKLATQLEGKDASTTVYADLLGHKGFVCGIDMSYLDRPVPSDILNVQASMASKVKIHCGKSVTEAVY